MKISIITEGGNNIGFGHITRCISLYQAFEEVGIKPELIVNGDENIKYLLREKNYRIFNWLEEKRKLFELVKNSNIAIIDSYLTSISVYENLSSLVEIPVYIDDAKRLNYPRGIVVNGSVCAETLHYPKKDGVIYLLGTEYTPLRKEFWEIPEKEIKEKIESIMVTFGGFDDRNLTPGILRFLRENYSFLKKNIIVAKGFQNINEIEKETDRNTYLIHNPDAKKIKEIMLESDIAISASGQTLYEFARIGVPTIGICVAENQLRNVKAWEKSGFLQYAGWWEDNLLYKKINYYIKELSNVNKRMINSQIGKDLIDGKGSRSISKFIINYKVKV